MATSLEDEYRQLRALRQGLAQGLPAEIIRARMGCTRATYEKRMATLGQMSGDAEGVFMRYVARTEAYLKDLARIQARTGKKYIKFEVDGPPGPDGQRPFLIQANPELDLNKARQSIKDQAIVSKNQMDVLHNLGMLKLMAEKVANRTELTAIETAKRVMAELRSLPPPSEPIPAVVQVMAVETLTFSPDVPEAEGQEEDERSPD